MHKLTFEYVKSEIESVEGYKLLSETYVNAFTKLKVKHDIEECGFEYEVSFGNFKNNERRCPECKSSKIADKLRFDYDYVKNEIEKIEGYKLLSDEYVNNHTKLKIKHEKCGTKYEVRFADFQRGCRCSECSKKQVADKHRHVYDYVKGYIESVDNKEYKLLSDEYINVDIKLKVKHDIEECGLTYMICFNSFKNNGYRCPKCSINKIARKLRHDYDYVKDYIESINNNEYKLLSDEYVNNHTKLKIKHNIKKCGHEYEVRFNDFQQEHRCPKCWKELQTSRFEQEVIQCVKEIIGPYVILETHNRDQVFNYTTGCFLELDIFLRERKKAVECNGDYWHGMSYQKEKDRIKQQQCKEKGIDLLVIEEKDWKKNKDKCKETILKFLNS